MNDGPKRSIGDTVGQLVVIAVLIAILIGAVILLRQYVHNHNSSAPISTRATYSFSCCAAFDPATIYHPGEVVRLAWTPIEAAPGTNPSRMITLAALLSKSFPSANAIKSSTKAGTFSTTRGPFIASSDQRSISNRYGNSPVMTLRIPGNARTGYYDLVTTVSQEDSSVSGGTIIQVRRST